MHEALWHHLIRSCPCLRVQCPWIEIASHEHPLPNYAFILTYAEIHTEGFSAANKNASRSRDEYAAWFAE